MIDGALNFYKPVGITSAKALYRVRKIIGVRKSGHAGTLDPGACGVLVISLGRGTKLTEAWMNQPKTYRATARLDVTSDSFDSDGAIQPVAVNSIPDEAILRTVLSSFQGTIEQVPPGVSAIKVGGQPAYRLAWKGKAPTLAARPVRIDWIRLLSYDWPVLEFEMACGRGTYVRALIRDVGLRLGTGGCLTALERRAVGPFTAEQSWTLQALETHGEAGDWLVPLAEVRRLLSVTGSTRHS